MKTKAIIAAFLLAVTSIQAENYIVQEKQPVLAGFAVGVDLVGPVMKMASSWSNMEVTGRLNFKEKYFPLVEVGVGTANRDGRENNNNFSTTAMYIKAGFDYNLNKKANGNRFMLGLRYGLTSFNYDFSNPDMMDDLYQVPMPIKVKDCHGSAQWLELVAGVETKLWSFIRLGVDGRFRFSTLGRFDSHGEPWYVPGYGIWNTTNFGAEMHLMFDFGRSMKKQKVKYNPAY